VDPLVPFVRIPVPANVPPTQFQLTVSMTNPGLPLSVAIGFRGVNTVPRINDHIAAILDDVVVETAAVPEPSTATLRGFVLGLLAYRYVLRRPITLKNSAGWYTIEC